jgi:hypothetical protein
MKNEHQENVVLRGPLILMVPASNLVAIMSLDWLGDPLACVLVVEILKAERNQFLLCATKEQMDQMERTCKKYGMDWETYISRLHKLALDPSLRRQASGS